MNGAPSIQTLLFYKHLSIPTQQSQKAVRELLTFLMGKGEIGKHEQI